MDENANPEPDEEPNPRPEEIRAWEEVFRDMDMEEQDEVLEQMLAWLKAHPEEMKAKFPEEDVEAMVARMTERVEAQRRLTAEVRKTEEAWLQSVADVADAEAKLTVMLGQIMNDVENFTEERWAALPVGMRAELMNHLQEWQQDKERILSQLPMEERRRLE